MTKELDYSGYGKTEASGGDLELLTGLAERQLDLEAEIAEKEKQLKALGAEHRELAWKQIPELMESIDLDFFRLKSGFEINVKDDLRLSIPKDPEKRAKVIEWLVENDGSYLIKEEFGFKFDKGQGDAAAEFAEYCEKYPGRLNMARAEGCETNSVKAFLKAKLEEGEDVPLDLLGGHRQTIAKIKKGKKK